MALPQEADVRLILSRIRVGAEYRWKGGAQNDITQVDWLDSSQKEPTEVEYDTEWNVIASEEATKNAVQQNLITRLDPTAGRAVADLTSGEQVSLLEAVVFVLDGLDKRSGLLRPLDEWVV